MSEVEQIQAVDGFKVAIGQRVDFSSNGGTDGRGIVREIRGDNVLIDVTEVLRLGGDRWPLKPEFHAKHGRPDFFGPRDNGVSLGCIRRPHWKWAGF